MGFKKMDRTPGFALLSASLHFVNFTGQAGFALASTLKHNRSLKFTQRNMPSIDILIASFQDQPDPVLDLSLFYSL